MDKLKITASRMQEHTWGRINVNTKQLEEDIPAEKSFAGEIGVRVPNEIMTAPEPSLGEPAGGNMLMPAEAEDFLRKHANSRYYIQIPRDFKSTEPITAEICMTLQSPDLTEDLVIEAAEGSEATVIIKYTCESGASARHFGRTRVIVHQGAKLHLIKAQMMNSDASHTDFVEGTVEENGLADVILAELGALKVTSSANILLEGNGAMAKLDVIYLGSGDRELDMSYRVEHRGKKTKSEIRAKGILSGRSRKMLRDTLDFVSGASGAKGREEESVLLLSPDVRNISVPLLLCGEDDVEGEHAASSGRLDEKILFYLMSRGIDETEARTLLAQAALAEIVERIPAEALKDEIIETVKRSSRGEGA